MITVTLLRDGQGRLRGFDCSGHAGYARAGKDIVCAAVSVLTTTCVNALESVAGVEPTVTVRDGAMRAVLTAVQADIRDAQIILRTFEQGISDIAASYSKHIRTEEQHYVET